MPPGIEIPLSWSSATLCACITCPPLGSSARIGGVAENQTTLEKEQVKNRLSSFSTKPHLVQCLSMCLE